MISPSYSNKLDRVLRSGLEISHVRDIDVLLERILTEARRLTGADAGSIYIAEEGQLHFRTTQNDTLQARLEEGRKLPYETFSMPISNKSISGYVASTGQLLNIADVYDLREGVPYSFDRKFDNLAGYRTCSMLTVPLKDNRSRTIGVLQLINASEEGGGIVPFDEHDIPLIMHFANNAAAAIERAQMTRQTILRMIKMTEMRDPTETGPHASRVAGYSLEIFETWAWKRQMPRKEIDNLKDILKVAAILHDVGKIAIPDSILKKPGKLTDEEYSTMKRHTWLGSRLFTEGNSEFDKAAATVTLNHHERWDGCGYPGHIDAVTGEALPGRATNGNGQAAGKSGAEIPIFGRVVAIADVFDALSSRRSYKEPWDEDRVLAELKRCSGSQFDPDMIDAFMESLDSIRAVTRRYPS